MNSTKYILKKIKELVKEWTQDSWLVVTHPN